MSNSLPTACRATAVGRGGYHCTVSAAKIEKHRTPNYRPDSG